VLHGRKLAEVDDEEERVSPQAELEAKYADRAASVVREPSPTTGRDVDKSE